MNHSEMEFAKDVVKAFLENYEAKDNNQYEFNLDKCDKMNEIIAYCQTLEKEFGCKIIRCMLEPKHTQGYVQVLFDGELSLGDKADGLAKFIDTLKLCDGINVTTNPAGDDMFQITFFVDDLWVLKQK